MIPHGRAEDPSGIAVQTRARDRRIQMFQDQMGDNYDVMNQASASHGPLPDPQWDGYFQAVDEAASGRPVKFGYATQEKADTSRDPVHAAETLDPNIGGMTALNSPSSQLGTALDGLRRFPVNTTAPFDQLQYGMEALGGANPYAVTPADPNNDAVTGVRRPEDPVARFNRLNPDSTHLGPSRPSRDPQMDPSLVGAETVAAQKAEIRNDQPPRANSQQADALKRALAGLKGRR